MNKHQYDVEVAIKYGVIPAILLDSIRRWIEYNIANDKNFREGKYWAYNSREAWLKQFPCLTNEQVRRALEKLRQEGLVETACLNQAAFDRTLWYTLTPLANELLYGENTTFDWAKSPSPIGYTDPIPLGTDTRPIPSIKQSIKEDTKVSKKRYKNGLENPEKTVRTDFVAFLPKEYAQIVKRFGSEEEAHAYMDYLGQIKLSYGYVYSSDYRASTNWGFDAYERFKHIKQRNAQGQQGMFIQPQVSHSTVDMSQYDMNATIEEAEHGESFLDTLIKEQGNG